MKPGEFDQLLGALLMLVAVTTDQPAIRLCFSIGALTSFLYGYYVTRKL